MDVGLGSAGLYLLLTGGFAAAAIGALVRRDGPSVLAMGVGAALAGQAAGLSSHLLDAEWTVLAVAMAAAVGAVALHRLLGGRTAFVTGAVVTASVLAAMASQPGAVTGRHAAPLAIGTAVHRQLAPLIAWRAIG